MMPQEIGRRKLQDVYFSCSCGRLWADAVYEVASKGCMGDFLGTHTKEPAGLCFVCHGQGTVTETSREIYNAHVEAKKLEREEAQRVAKEALQAMPAKDWIAGIINCDDCEAFETKSYGKIDGGLELKICRKHDPR